MSVLVRGGRVVDPGNGRNEIIDILVDDARIAAVGVELETDADVTIDAAGLIVGPGFIDLHSHVHSIAGHWLQALDGVTTALDLEAGRMPVERAYAEAQAEGRPLNFGFSASWSGARGVVLAGAPFADRIIDHLLLFGNAEWQRSSTPKEMAAWLNLLYEELAAGALGIGILLGYAPDTDPAEMVSVARLAVGAGVPTFSHVRELVEADPSGRADGPSEIAMLASETGAHMHHCHVNSASRRHIDRVLDTLARAQSAGSKITVEAYPYGAGSTGIGAYFLEPERLERRGLRPESIVVVATGERIASADRLRELRSAQPDALVILEYLDETVAADMALLQRSLEFPDTIVASDAMPVVSGDGRPLQSQWPLPPGACTHPRTSGTFAKAIRMMVGSGAWDWQEAFKRCSWLPAQVLSFAEAASRKGHLGVGADADIVVLDPAQVSEHATYSSPVQPSSGIRYLMVCGEFVVRDAQLVTDAFPGRPLKANPR